MGFLDSSLIGSFLPILREVLPVFLIAAIGAAIRKLGWLTEEADQSLLRVTVNLLIPSLIFGSILDNEALRQAKNVILPPVIGFITVVLGLALGYLCRHRTNLPGDQAKRTFAYSVGIYNYGYVPIPLTILLFDKETVGVLFVHNVGVELAMWTVGLMVLTGGEMRSFWRHMLNPPIIAIALGLSLNLSDSADLVPQSVLTAADMLGNCAIPIGLMLVGATIADYLHQFQATWRWPLMGWGSVLRLLLLPVLFLTLGYFVPGSIELKRVIVIQAAMPAASLPIILAKHYGGDPNTALQVVLATSLLGLLSIPTWIALGNRLLL